MVDGNTISNVGSLAANGFAIFNLGGTGVSITNNKIFDTNSTPTTMGIGGSCGAKNVIGGNIQLSSLAGFLMQINLSSDTTLIGQINFAGQTRFTNGVEIVDQSNDNANNPVIISGAGAPSLIEPDSSLYLRTDGTTGARLYVSSGGAWAAVSGV